MPPRPWNTLLNQGSVVILLTAFVLFGFFTYRDAQADDLASSYIGCRLVATGNAAHLYAYDPDDFAAVGDNEAWQEAADFGGFTSFQHPYVQTPLWAYILKPICGGSFATFRQVFAGAVLLAFAACLWLVVRFWAPSFLAPLPIRYRSPLPLVFRTLPLCHVPRADPCAIFAADGRGSYSGGAPPTWLGRISAGLRRRRQDYPRILVLYWVLTRRWKAAASMALWSGTLIAITLTTTGWPLFAAYLADLHRIANVMLLAFNNQSFTAWVMGYFYPEQVDDFNILPLPAAIRLGSMALMLVLTAMGGILDRRKASDPEVTPAPFGAMIALIAGTICAPIAWTHYSIVLAVPLMILWHECKERRSYWIAAAVVIILALNFQPLATNMTQGTRSPFTLVRSEFYAGILCIATLAVAKWINKRPKRGQVPDSSSDLLLNQERSPKVER